MLVTETFDNTIKLIPIPNVMVSLAGGGPEASADGLAAKIAVELESA